jgi:hypothetical protein
MERGLPGSLGGPLLSNLHLRTQKNAIVLMMTRKQTRTAIPNAMPIPFEDVVVGCSPSGAPAWFWVYIAGAAVDIEVESIGAIFAWMCV